MKALSIALKDLQILFKDRGQIFYLLLLPLLFVLVLTGALGSIGASPADTRIALPVVDLDKGEPAQALLKGLDAAGGVRVELYEQNQAADLLDEATIPFVLTIPTGFSADVAAGRAATVRLVNHPDANAERTEAVRLVIEGVTRDMSLQTQILGALEQMGQMQAGVPAAERAFAVEQMQAQARSQFQAAQAQPLVSVAQRAPLQPSKQEDTYNSGDIAVPGIAVLFAFLASQATASSIFSEKKNGTFRRLLAAPMSKASLLLGKILPNFLLALLQTAIIFAFGIVGLRLLGLPSTTLGNNPLVTLLVLVLLALCASAFGVLIAAFAHTEAQIGGLSTLLVFVMGIAGGAFIPLFILERVLGPLPKIVPQYWANHALTNLMVRGLGLADVLPDIGMLLVFTVLFFAVGLWRFDFER